MTKLVPAALQTVWDGTTTRPARDYLRCYCSPNATLETAWAIFVELERFEGQRWEFMFWNGDPKPAGLEISKLRIRDLRPGDIVVFNGWRRKVLRVEIFR